ncbi:Syntaxin-7 [Sciurus carolinensis]|uniref:Syntaxin-7 n=1 Tax=Sciurus carolinensis TaxID=30640 RepID=A0AA41T336_SCICA|nr:Syntaxin-7 [Sciurus carolinensis]
MAAATCNQTCKYCNSELSGNSRQLVLHWWSAISLLTVVGRSGAVEIQRTLNQLGTPQDSPELRQQLQQKQQYTNQLAKETDKYIKEFGSLPTTPSEQRQRKIQKDRLVAEFTTSLTNFQKVQRQAAEREKEFVARVRASSRVSADIMDINEIFKDLGMMIHEQGDVIDSIEANVESAEVHVQQANQQLSRAADYQCVQKKLLSWWQQLDQSWESDICEAFTVIATSREPSLRKKGEKEFEI